MVVTSTVIRAKDAVPFEEHIVRGCREILVEDGDEFFVELRSSPGSHTIADLCIDGEGVGFAMQMGPWKNLTERMGLIAGDKARPGEALKLRSFKFVCKDTSQDGGTIRVTWTHADPSRPKKPILNVEVRAGDWKTSPSKGGAGLQATAFGTTTGAAQQDALWAPKEWVTGEVFQEDVIRYRSKHHPDALRDWSQSWPSRGVPLAESPRRPPAVASSAAGFPDARVDRAFADGLRAASSGVDFFAGPQGQAADGAPAGEVWPRPTAGAEGVDGARDAPATISPDAEVPAAGAGTFAEVGGRPPEDSQAEAEAEAEALGASVVEESSSTSEQSETSDASDASDASDVSVADDAVHRGKNERDEAGDGRLSSKRPRLDP